MTIEEFLLARIAEDEEAARWGPWDAYDISVRVLAECVAKRRIVEHETAWARAKAGAPPYNGPLTRDDDEPGRHPQLVAYLEQWGEQVTDTPILRLLALPYADHPDYREAWQPTR